MRFFAIGFPMLPTPVNPTGVLEAIDLEHTAARLATAGGCRRLQYRRLEAAPGSHKEAAMLPPPRLPSALIFLSVKFHRQRSLAGSLVGTCPWSHKELATEPLSKHVFHYFVFISIISFLLLTLGYCMCVCVSVCF